MEQFAAQSHARRTDSACRFREAAREPSLGKRLSAMSSGAAISASGVRVTEA